MRRAIIFLLPVLMSAPALAQEVRMPLSVFEAKQRELAELQKKANEANEQSAALIGETTYRGQVEDGHLRVKLSLRAQLADSSAFKMVPVLGLDSVVIGATRGGKPIALARRGGMWTWMTRARGPVEIDVEFIVAPRGPRGSIEYRFGVVESPVTRLFAEFAKAGLSPKVTGAVASRVDSKSGGTRLKAVLEPTRRIEIVGFHDLVGKDAGQQAKVYGETHNLVSLADDRVELFSVVDLTILYGAAKNFRIALPRGYDVVSAAGQGAFQYRIEESEDGPVLLGETAFGIRDRYEISIRLRRSITNNDDKILLPVPRLLDVERDTGYVAIEIPGKLAVGEAVGDGLTSIDVRELPEAIVENSVSPVVRAFRYSGKRGAVSISLARYPEKTLATGGVDRLRAISVLTADGRVMTDALFTIRNNLRQYLVLDLAEGAAVESAAIDGDPIKPSRDANGKVLIPLKRSRRSAGRLRPFKIQLVYSFAGADFGSLGSRALTLPKLDVPIASLEWRVYTPSGYRTSALSGPIKAQRFVKNASWHRTSVAFADLDEDELGANQDAADAPTDQHRVAAGDDGDRGHGAMPVRIKVPRSGDRSNYRQYWISAGETPMVSFSFARTSLVLAAQVAVTVLFGAALFFAVLMLVGRRFAAFAGLAVAGWTANHFVGGSAFFAALIGLVLVLVVTGVGRPLRTLAAHLVRQNIEAIKTRLSAAGTKLIEQFRADNEKNVLLAIARPAWAVTSIGARLFIATMVFGWLFSSAVRLISLLGNPL